LAGAEDDADIDDKRHRSIIPSTDRPGTSPSATKGRVPLSWRADSPQPSSPSVSGGRPTPGAQLPMTMHVPH
jgi:hypothetical protein